MESIIIVVLSAAAGILIGRFIIRPLMNRKTNPKNNRSTRNKNNKK